MTDRSGWRALLIGVAEYDDDEFRNVPAALNSVRALKNILTDPNLCGWPKECVTVIEDPHRPIDVGRPLRKFALDATEADTLLVYFVGHGVLNELGELCLVLKETEQSDVDFSGLEYDKLRAHLKNSQARTKIVILDCCHSGKAIEALSGSDSEIADRTEISGAYTLTAAEQAAHVPSSGGQDSRTSFTNALVELIRHGVPGGDEFLNLSTIYGKLTQRLISNGLPRPNQRGTNNVENFEFARNSAYSSVVSDVPTVSQQLPDDSTGLEMLDAIRRRFDGRESDFLQCALSIWRLIEPTTGKCEIVRAKNGSTVAGKYMLGPIDDRIELEFQLDARCYPVAKGVDYSAMERLISRIRNCHFGVFLTLSYVEEAVYQHIRSEQQPVTVVCGKDVIDVLQTRGCTNAAEVEEWLDGQLSLVS
ncbi:caspase family protein [Nocardia sp. NPDC006044]|uniref:caspase, EACC1-associated type n=1 Tax=Nocardia sp. NPDC006044 TaxID=3364306 RepID=UPI00369D2EF6